MSSPKVRLMKIKLKKIVPLESWRVIKGDEVFVNSGKDKGKIGKILKVDRRRNKVLVQGVNLVKKHVKSTEEFKGGIFTKEAPIHVSNVQLIDPISKRPTRIATKFLEDGTKVRISKRSGEIIPKPTAKYVELRRKQQKDGPKDTGPETVAKRTYNPPNIEALIEGLRNSRISAKTESLEQLD